MESPDVNTLSFAQILEYGWDVRISCGAEKTALRARVYVCQLPAGVDDISDEYYPLIYPARKKA